MEGGLKEKTAKGLLWGALNSGSTQLLNLIFGIFLGRLITPAEYGIVGVLSIFTLIAGNLQSSGFTQALVNLKAPRNEDYTAVFWFNTLTSFVLYALLFLSAPLIARFFHQPCLVEVSRFVFLSFVISSFGIAHNAYMTKNMMNRELAIIGAIALLCSGGVATFLAFYGFSYWSLAWQQIIYITVLNIGRYYYTPWRPSWHFTFEPVRKMFGFSVKILITNIINTLSNNILTLLFGRLYPIKAVGDYSQAYKWNTMASAFVANAVGQVAQPVLASVKEEQGRSVRVFRKMLRFTAFLSFPAMFGLAIISNEFILLTIGKRWIDAVPLLQMLCIGGAFVPFYTLYQNVAISNGRSDIYMFCNIAQIVLQLVIIGFFYHLGINTMVMVYTLFTIAWLFVWQWTARRIIGLRFREVIKDVMPTLCIALLVMATTYFVTLSLHHLLLLLICRILIATLLYAAIMKLLHVEMMDELLLFIKKR
ncbi:Membrane protein involved in the export of O-antigen and teichoic acid [Segatella oulorum]|uniref:Membrane protein involved in the export of O-antigen and teichoic acid n=1 Tax=Segatella oulorum TaxID=28136 RepID=A0A1T4MM89_9BACT|nr:lipopolysaccharide biosynthesis protein [Segatella oulorum]SJZ67884.1 Membrane protein involved in the export of O-antigen and teichoic acid [Segatella oulorum]